LKRSHLALADVYDADAVSTIKIHLSIIGGAARRSWSAEKDTKKEREIEKESIDFRTEA
jgi:hypothetical protein